jgi:hypothetical protein
MARRTGQQTPLFVKPAHATGKSHPSPPLAGRTAISRQSPSFEECSASPLVLNEYICAASGFSGIVADGGQRHGGVSASTFESGVHDHGRKSQ